MSQTPAENFLDEDSFFSEMLSSQSGLEDQITRIKEIIDCSRSSEDKIEEVFNFLSKQNLQHATIDILDEKLFSVAFDCATKVYLEIIQTLNEILKNKEQNIRDDVKKQLKLLSQIISIWSICLDHLKTFEKISIIDIKSVPESLFKVFSSALNHCKNSADTFGNSFSFVAELLASFFRQCINIVNSFYLLLDTVISFDTNREEEIKILFEIIDETGKLATLVCNMESKTLTDMWKRFGKLSTLYALEIKKLSAEKVTRHFLGLSKNIISIMSTVNKNNQRMPNERAILCCRVLMKILEKLCDTYCGWIRKDVMIGIIDMVAELYRYINKNLRMEAYDSELVKLVDSNFSIVIEPFFDVLFKNDIFKLAFFDYKKNNSENMIGYHYLMLTIIKKISTLSYEEQRQWCIKENSILNHCFENIDKLTHEICTGRLQALVSRDAAQTPYMANIYEATCLNIFSLVCQISSEDFFELEILLLKHLLSGKFFASLLSSDIWCFICRLGTSEMCYDHFCYLQQVFETLKNRRNDLNVIVLANLLGRQYTFLAEKDKLNFINNIKKSSDPHSWSPILQVMDTDKKKTLQQQIDVNLINDRLSGDLKSLEEHPSLENFLSLTNDLLIIKIFNYPHSPEIMHTFLNMWNKIVNIMADCEGPALFLLEDLVTSLMHATYLEQGKDEFVTSILDFMVSLYPYASSSLRLEYCYFLKSCSSYLTTREAVPVTELFIRLLGDEDPCVQQQGFESFEFLTQSCPDAEFISSVAMSIRNAQNEISKILPAYISNQVVHSLNGFSSFADFFKELSRSVSRSKTRWIERKNQVCREEKVPRMDSGENFNADFEMKAETICKDLENIEKIKGHLKKDTWEKLRKVCQSILEKKQ